MSHVSCHCGLPEPYAECCGRYHAGAEAPTAELLMRARYSAFAVGDPAYLLRTWPPRTRPRRLTLDPRQRWTRLELLDRVAGGLFDQTGEVEFRAHYVLAGTSRSQHERSTFTRVQNRWLYAGSAPAADHRFA
jgi:SEC-C motif-containing protein